MPTVITCGPGGSTTQEVFDAVNEANQAGADLAANLQTTVTSAATAVTAANEAELDRQAAESAANTATNAKNAIESYVIPTEATYSPQLIDSKINALAPYSGYTQVSKKLDNFVFKTDANFTYSVADKNRYVKFGDKVVDTYGPELITNGDFSDGLTGWTAVNGASIENNNGRLKVINGSFGVAYTSFSTTVGHRYLVTLNIDATEQQARFLLDKDGPSNDMYSGEYIETGKTSSIEYSFTAISGTVFLSLQVGSVTAGEVAHFDNISVREIKTADFSNDIPDVTEVITDGSNTTSVSVNAGDYVLDGSELVANGTFDIDTSGWTAHSGVTLGVDNSRLSMASSTVAGAYKSLLGLVSGNVYTLKITRTSTNITRFYISGNGYSSGAIYTSSQISGNGTIEVITFTATASTMYIVLYNTSSGTSYWDNISVKRVSNTFRAKQDAPIGTALTNTTYFEDRTEIGVTNQALAYHAYNTLTNSYEGIKTEVLFSDVSKADLLDNSVWMARNGFNKVSQFLYSKGSYLCLPIGIWQSLNKGAYHPFLNGFGCGNASSIDGGNRMTWYTTNRIAASTAQMFIEDYTYPFVDSYKYGVLTGTIAYGYNGRPDSKYYDIVYPDQFIDVRQYAKIATPYEIELIRKDKEENGISEIVFTEQVTQTTTGTVDTLEVSDGTKYKAGSVLQIWNGTTPYRRYVASVNGNTVTLDSTIVKTAVPFIIGGGRLPILSSGTSLSIDLIGAPNA